MARPADLLSVEEARSRILAQFRRLGAETVPLTLSVGRVLYRPVAAPITVPPFANSSMDGFAVCSEDTAGAHSAARVSLPVRATIAAGSGSAVSLPRGSCARIMTGAPLPDGSDAVVPFEEVDEEDGRIFISTPISSGSCVRPAGNDVRAGMPLLPAGVELGARQIGLLASVGLSDVEVARRPTVAILSTGEELVEPGTALRRGQIYNTNSPMLAAAVQEAGGEPLVLPASGDDAASIAEALSAAADADLVLTSGGASVGDFDLVKSVIGSEGELDFWKVRVRPGKPLLFGTVLGRPIIGLPGNPTSSMVTFELFARPAIRTMLGAAPLRPEVDVIAGFPVENDGGRRTYLRVVLQTRDGRLHAIPSGPQDSAMLLPLARADGLLVVREDCERLAAGETARVLVWRLPEPGS